MNNILFYCIIITSISCSELSTNSEEISSTSLGDNPLVESISYSKIQGSQTVQFVDNYYYEGSALEGRTETNLDAGRIQTYEYTYTNNLISNVHSFRSDGHLVSELQINYDNNQRVVSYNQVQYFDDASSTYWQAVFLYDNDKLLHCDGQTWSSVEYKDVYESIHLYTMNAHGDFVHMKQVEDCSFSATSSNSYYEIFVDYDDKPSPFSNVQGNNFVINHILGVFTNSEVNGVYNNATKMTTSRSDVEEIQTWDIAYHETDHPQSMSLQREERTEEDIVFTYYEVTD